MSDELKKIEQQEFFQTFDSINNGYKHIVKSFSSSNNFNKQQLTMLDGLLTYGLILLSSQKENLADKIKKCNQSEYQNNHL